MRELLGDLAAWRAAGIDAVVVRLVGVEGSGPRGPGAAMAVNAHGEVAGSVSGGCLEAALVEEARSMLESASGDTGREPGRLVRFGFSHDDALDTGLTCGGTVELFVERVTPEAWPTAMFNALMAAVGSGEPIALATVVGGPSLGAKLLVSGDEEVAVAGTLGHAELDRVVARDARGQLAQGVSGARHYGPAGQAREDDVSVFVESFAPPPRMIIFGAVDFTAALAATAKLLGFRVTVCDPRSVFATSRRFPMADEVVTDWPDRYLDGPGSDLGPRDAVCVLTHDAKFDVPAIVGALRSDVGYIGVMGSRWTHERRVRRLREAGVGAEELARVMAPIGLDIGARTPEETAVSICAEIVARRTGRIAPVSLRDSTGPIH